jgi:EpsI family protein
VGASLKFTLVALMLAGTAIFLQCRPSREVSAPRQPFNLLPNRLGAWGGAEVPLPPAVLDVLGAGDFLSRTYRNGFTSEAVDLFMAYFPTQRSGDTIHSPENCLPGSGWSPLESKQIVLSLPGHPPFRANRYLIGKGEERKLVLYWYWAHDRAEASEYLAKFYLVADSMRLNRSDGALVRVSTSLGNGEGASSGQKRLVAFTKELIPIVNTYVPR